MIVGDTVGDNLASSLLAGELIVCKGNSLPVFVVSCQNDMICSGQGLGSRAICSLNEICELTHKRELC